MYKDTNDIDHLLFVIGITDNNNKEDILKIKNPNVKRTVLTFWPLT